MTERDIKNRMRAAASITAMKHKGRQYWIARILNLMSDEQEWTIAALAMLLDVSYGTIWAAMQVLLVQGKLEERRRDALSPQRFYSIESAPLTEAEPQAPTMIEDDDAEREAWLDRRHRSRATWWPVADTVVATAMADMVRCSSSPDSTTNSRPIGRRKA